MTPAAARKLELRNQVIAAQEYSDGDFCVACDEAGRENVPPVATLIEPGRRAEFLQLLRRGSRAAVVRACRFWAFTSLCARHLREHHTAPFAAGVVEAERLRTNRARTKRYARNKAETGNGHVSAAAIGRGLRGNLRRSARGAS